MNKILEKVYPAFKIRAEDLMKEFNRHYKDAYEIRPFSGLRTLQEQAFLWRAGRTTKLIRDEITMLESMGCDLMAEAFKKTIPNPEKRILTKAMPGQSYHNYGVAIDFVVFDLKSRKANWDGKHATYKKMAEIAEYLGLEAGLRFGDPVHIQNPLEFRLEKMKLLDINSLLKSFEEKFKEKNQEKSPLIMGYHH